MLVLLGDLDAQINNDRQGVEDIVGPNGSPRNIKDDNEYLIYFCILNDLCIRNFYFKHKTYIRRRKNLDGKIENETDFICISRRWMSGLTKELL